MIFFLISFHFLLPLPLTHTHTPFLTFLLGYRCAVIPGGIAEMYLVSEKQESLYLRKRQSTVKAAIQEGIILLFLLFFKCKKSRI